MTDLTPKQRAVFAFVAGRLADTGVAPTFREIMDHFKWRSPNAVSCHTGPLEAKGYLCPGPGGTLAVPGLAEHLAPHAREYLAAFAPGPVAAKAGAA